MVRVHSEKSLAKETGIHADFDGDGRLDDLDSDGIMNGDEMVVFVVDQVTLRLDPNDTRARYAMFLDHMVELVNVTPNEMAQLQIWDTGGGLEPVPLRIDPVPDQPGSSHRIDPVPHRLGPLLPYPVRSMGIVGRNKVNVEQILPGGNNLGQVDGGWFVYVRDLNPAKETVSVAIGRALGNTHSASSDGGGRHDLEKGDPGYLKRWFVDGHEYDVVAVRAYPMAGVIQDDKYGFAYITIRTPVPLVDFASAHESQALQGYPAAGTASRPISVMPPYSFNHTITESIQVGAGDTTGGALTAECRPALRVIPLEAAAEQAFTGELKELLTTEAPEQTNTVKLVWKSQLLQTLPDRYCSLGLPSDERYLLTSSWRAVDGQRGGFGYAVKDAEDSYINLAPWAWTQLRAPVAMGSAPVKVATASQGTVKQAQRIHVVASGETLTKIAERYQVTVASIIAANVLRDGNMNFVGQRLVIP